MDKVFSIIILMIAPQICILNSQKNPNFLTTFYFEDAIGNRDTMEIGYDITANHGNNPEFGEVTDLSPFDSIFDVRAVNYFEFYNTTPPINPLNLLVKRIVGGASKVVNAPCQVGDFLIFFIHAIHQPITLSIKSIIDFEKIDCPGRNTWNFFTPDRTYHYIEPWGWASTPGVRFGCLRDSTFTLYLDKKHKPFIEKPYILNYEIEGRGRDTILGVSFILSQSFYQCDSSYVNTIENSFQPNFKVYPNPATDRLQIEIVNGFQPIGYSIFNQTGLMIHRNDLKNQLNIELNIESLNSGLHFLQLKYLKGSVVKKFVKN